MNAWNRRHKNKITISQSSMSSGCKSQQQMRPLLSGYNNHHRPWSIMREHGMQVRSRTKDKWELSNCHTTSVYAGITQKILKPSGYQCCLTMHQRSQFSRLTISKPRSHQTRKWATPVTKRRSEYTCTRDKHSWKRHKWIECNARATNSCKHETPQ